MANYYTTRFNPIEWPPEGGDVPPGVVVDRVGLRERGQGCCDALEILESTARPGDDRWVYRVIYRFSCPEHGDAILEIACPLDWLSPNEYLIS